MLRRIISTFSLYRQGALCNQCGNSSDSSQNRSDNRSYYTQGKRKCYQDLSFLIRNRNFCNIPFFNQVFYFFQKVFTLNFVFFFLCFRHTGQYITTCSTSKEKS